MLFKARNQRPPKNRWGIPNNALILPSSKNLISAQTMPHDNGVDPLSKNSA